MQTENIFPMSLLREYSYKFPRAWRQIAQLREDRGKDLPWWPDWCYCPIAGAIAVITNGSTAFGTAEFDAISETPPAVMAALASWRITKGIYRFDATLLEEVVNMPLEGNLPAEVFLTLPEWAIWVDVPPSVMVPPPDGSKDLCVGFFAHLEYDVRDFRTELRIAGVFNTGAKEHKIHFIGVHIGNWSLAEGVERAYEEGKKEGRLLPFLELPKLSEAEYERLHAWTINYLTPLVNMILYICSANADFGEREKPIHPSRKSPQKGKIFAAQDVRNWDIGVRLGPALRRARQDETEPQEGGEERAHASPRPHYRRAHWHHFWTGPRDKPDKRKLVLKWLPPIPVGIKDVGDSAANAPAVIYYVNRPKER